MPALFTLGFDAVMLGFEYALLAVGVFVSFRILHIADLTVDGSFCLGMAVCTTFAVAGHPVLGLVAGTVAGALAGCVTGGLIAAAKINPLLAGIITMTGLYSVNIYVLGGPNVSLLNAEKIYQPVKQFVGAALTNSQVKMVVVVVLVAVVVALVAAYFRTESGLAMRATGDNEEMCRASSINTDAYKIAGLALANALVGLSGAILAQYQGFADVNAGSGMVMVGLASVILGELFGARRSVTAGLVCTVIGSVLYRVVVQAALSVNLMDSNALKLVTAVLVALFMSMPAIRAFIASRKERAAARRSAEELAAKTLASQAATAQGSVSQDPSSQGLTNNASGNGEAVCGAEPMLQAIDLKKTFNAGTPLEHKGLDGANVVLRPGEFACVVGSNGAGKSTLFNVIAGSVHPDGGLVRLAGHDVTFVVDYQRARTLSRVFQDPMRGTAPGLTVAENVALAYGRSKKKPMAIAMRSSMRKLVKERLEDLGFGLEDRMDVPVGSLSGGQRQAVTLLMATIGNPDLLLLDEHTAALDPEATKRILELTTQICRERGITAMMVTHNLSSALQMGDRTIVMDEGCVVADLGPEERKGMTVDNLLELFRSAAGHDLDDDKVLLAD